MSNATDIINQKYSGKPLQATPKNQNPITGGVSDFWNKSVMPLVNLPGNIYKAAQTLGSGLSTTAGNPGTSSDQTQIPQQQADQSAQNAQSVAKLIPIYHSTTNPTQKQHLANAIVSMGGNELLGGNKTDITSTDINPGFGLSNKQVVGAAGTLAVTAAGGFESPAPVLTNTAIGAIYGGSQSAMNNQSGADIATNAVIGGLTAGGATAAMPYASNLFGANHPIFQRTNAIVDPKDFGIPEAQQEVNQSNVANPQQFTTQEQQRALDTGQQNVSSAGQNLDLAQQNRQAIAPKAVNDLNTANQATQSDVGKGGALGQEFGSGIKSITDANPTNSSALSQAQLDTLNGLKQGKDFQLPDSLNQDNLTPTTASGQSLNIKDPVARAKFEATMRQAAGETSGVKLNSTQAADLMKELNRTTYKIVDGQKVIDQSRIGITKELEAQFAKDFGNLKGTNGETWADVYGKFKRGVQFRDKLDGLVNFDKNATPADLNSQLDGLKKLVKTPEGKIMAQQTIDAYAKERNIDLSPTLQAANEIMNRDAAVKEMQTNFNKAQKDYSAVQKDVASANQASLKEAQSNAQSKLKQAQSNYEKAVAESNKPGYFERLGNNLKVSGPSYVLRRLLFKIMTGL